MENKEMEVKINGHKRGKNPQRSAKENSKQNKRESGVRY